MVYTLLQLSPSSALFLQVCTVDKETDPDSAGFLPNQVQKDTWVPC